MLSANKLSEIYIMVHENSTAVRVQNVKFRLLIDRRNWSIFVNLYARFEVVDDEYLVCVRIGVTWWFMSSGLLQSFRNPKCLMIRDPRCMLVSEAHFSGWGCSRAGDGNRPSVGKGNDYMTRVLIIHSTCKALVPIHQTIHEVDDISWKRIDQWGSILGANFYLRNII